MAKVKWVGLNVLGRIIKEDDFERHSFAAIAEGRMALGKYFGRWRGAAVCSDKWVDVPKGNRRFDVVIGGLRLIEGVKLIDEGSPLSSLKNIPDIVEKAFRNTPMTMYLVLENRKGKRIYVDMRYVRVWRTRSVSANKVR